VIFEYLVVLIGYCFVDCVDYYFTVLLHINIMVLTICKFIFSSMLIHVTVTEYYIVYDFY